MTPYDTIVKETLKYNLLPCVVPELKSITLGGAISGIGIESSSFKYGFVHETVLEMEILLSSGETVLCSPTNEYKDLFFGIPNSYGTLGYILRASIRLQSAKPFVKLNHLRFYNSDTYFNALQQCLEMDFDFVDGVVFNDKELYLTQGRFVDKVPYTSNYTYRRIYYRSIQQRKTDYLKCSDYIWRWDTDWFWCSRVFGLQNRFVRLLIGKWTLNSRFYLKLGRINKKLGFLSFVRNLLKINTESIIQDVEIPINRAREYLNFQISEIPILPIWICPMRSSDQKFDIYETKPEMLYINFGFWQIIKSTKENGYYNRRIETMVEELQGRKSLYSESYYSEDQFWKIYNQNVYNSLKEKYDDRNMFVNLYKKCVLKQ